MKRSPGLIVALLVLSSFVRIGGAQGLPTSLDGIPDSWRESYFGAGFRTNPAAVAVADPDGDGANNFEEFLAGTNPRRPVALETYAGGEELACLHDQAKFLLPSNPAPRQFFRAIER